MPLVVRRSFPSISQGFQPKCTGLKTSLVASSLRSKIGADGQNPIVFVLWVSVADGKLVARSHSER